MKKYIVALVLAILVLIGMTTLLVLTVLGKLRDDKTDYLAKARDSKNQQQYAQAIQFYEQALEKNPDQPQAYIDEAEIYLSKNRTEDALRVLKKGVKVVTNKNEINLALGKLYFETGDNANAETYLNTYYTSNKTNTTVNYYLGRIAFMQMKYDKARGYFEPQISHKQSLFEMAILDYDKPDVSLNWIAKAKAATGSVPELELLERDMQAVQTAINNKKTDPLVKTLKASALNHADRCEPAVDLLNSAIEIQEKITPYVNARIFLGDCFFKLKSYAKAKEILEKTYEMDKSIKEVREILVLTYDKLNENDKAIAMMRDLITLDQKNVNYRKNLITKYISLNKYEDALFEANELTKVDANPDYQFQKASILVNNLSRFQDGVEFLAPLIKEEATSGSRFLDLYGWSLYKTGNKTDGLKYINEALNKDSKYAPGYYHRGMIDKADAKLKDKAKQDFYNAVDYDLSGEISTAANDEYNKL